MSENAFQARSGLQLPEMATLAPAPSSDAGVRIALKEDFQIASVAARRGQVPDLNARCRALAGITMRDGPARVCKPPFTILGVGPDRWLLLRAGDMPLARDLAIAFGASASVCDQSDGYVIFQVSGHRARNVLAKGVPIDLDPEVFDPGRCAVTTIAHIGAIVWQSDDLPTYEIAIFRSFADAFWHWLIASSAQFGVTFDPTSLPIPDHTHD